MNYVLLKIIIALYTLIVTSTAIPQDVKDAALVVVGNTAQSAQAEVSACPTVSAPATGVSGSSSVAPLSTQATPSAGTNTTTVADTTPVPTFTIGQPIINTNGDIQFNLTVGGIFKNAFFQLQRNPETHRFQNIAFTAPSSATPTSNSDVLTFPSDEISDYDWNIKIYAQDNTVAATYTGTLHVQKP